MPSDDETFADAHVGHLTTTVSEGISRVVLCAQTCVSRHESDWILL